GGVNRAITSNTYAGTPARSPRISCNIYSGNLTGQSFLCVRGWTTHQLITLHGTHRTSQIGLLLRSVPYYHQFFTRYSFILELYAKLCAPIYWHLLTLISNEREYKRILERRDLQLKLALPIRRCSGGRPLNYNIYA